MYLRSMQSVKMLKLTSAPMVRMSVIPMRPVRTKIMLQLRLNRGHVGTGIDCELAPCPENASGAPNCVCDQGYAGRLFFDPVNGWQGICEEIDLCAGVICQVGEVCDPDTGNCVSCDRAYECVNGAYCETGDQPACWRVKTQSVTHQSILCLKSSAQIR